jgi:hypothetical protein
MESSVRSVRVFPGADDQWYYTPKGGNGEVLSTSEGYTEKNSALRAASDAYPGVEIVVDEPFLH